MPTPTNRSATKRTDPDPSGGQGTDGSLEPPSAGMSCADVSRVYSERHAAAHLALQIIVIRGDTFERILNAIRTALHLAPDLPWIEAVHFELDPHNRQTLLDAIEVVSEETLDARSPL